MRLYEGSVSELNAYWGICVDSRAPEGVRLSLSVSTEASPATSVFSADLPSLHGRSRRTVARYCRV